MELSNRTLVYLISISIIIILISTTINLTKLGKIQGITGLIGGPVNITVSTTASINLTNGVINWGSGQVAQGFTNATLDTNNDSAYVRGGSWSTTSIRPFILQNVGNVPVNVTINSTTNATAFLGGSGPRFAYSVFNAAGNSTACESGLIAPEQDFNPAGNASNKVRICNAFNFTAQRDHLWININITIPDNAPTGSKNTTIYFDACDVSGGSCSP